MKETNPKRYTVTSALPYANGALHLGHLAGAYLPADIYVRYMRLMGKDILWVCGSDEHGAAITIRSKKEGVSPQEIIDKYHNLNKDTFEKLGISFDFYHRTSEQIHHETAQEIFLKLLEKGDQFDEKVTEQYYDEKFQQFLADRYIIGTCPKCGFEEAFGDQCEQCGSDLSPLELVNPRSTMSGEKPTLKETKHWFFKLDSHEKWLKEWVKEGTIDGKFHHNPKTWKNHVIGQCMSWLDTGLMPRSITRDLDWGIKVPVEGAEGKVLYVWFDAPIGYISATKQWALDNGKKWKDYWQSDDTQLIHFIGKDNIVFHCIVFPAMLKAHGDYNLPINVPANQFLNFEGRKFSKSRGWGIEQHVYLEKFKDFPNKEDALRYALTKIMPENKDSDFTWDEFIAAHDNELVANFGNFVNRVVVLTNKYFDGAIPSLDSVDWSEKHKEVLDLIKKYQKEIETFHFRNAANVLMEISSYGNTYLQDVSPWSIFKTDPEDPLIAESMFVANQIVALLAMVSKPFLPFTSDKLQGILNLNPVQNGDLATAIEKLGNNQPIIKGGHQIGKPTLLFAKIHDRKDSSRLELINAQRAELEAILAAEVPKHESVKAQTSFDDFTKMDMRTGTIVKAEKMKKAKKLLQLEVDLGFETRTIVSGIAEYFSPEDVIGQQVVVLCNLAPRKLRGVESNGMILMAENEKGELAFVNAKDGFGNGFVVR